MSVTVQPVGKGVPTDKSLLYLPTVDDLKLICLEHFTKRQNFYDDQPMFSLQEIADAAQVENLEFNVEFAKITGTEINLSRK